MVEEIMQKIDEATKPPMPPDDAIVFLEEIVDEVKSRIEALHEQIGD